MAIKKRIHCSVEFLFLLHFHLYYHFIINFSAWTLNFFGHWTPFNSRYWNFNEFQCLSFSLNYLKIYKLQFYTSHEYAVTSTRRSRLRFQLLWWSIELNTDCVGMYPNWGGVWLMSKEFHYYPTHINWTFHQKHRLPNTFRELRSIIFNST